MRHVKVTSVEDIREDVLAELIRAAVALNVPEGGGAGEAHRAV